MTGSHLGHDCVVADGVTVRLRRADRRGLPRLAWASLGLGAVVHQDTVVGPGAMIGMGSPVRGVVGPFSLMVGNPARQAGFNTVGLTRRGCPDASMPALEAYLRGRGGAARRPPGRRGGDCSSAGAGEGRCRARRAGSLVAWRAPARDLLTSPVSSPPGVRIEEIAW